MIKKKKKIKNSSCMSNLYLSTLYLFLNEKDIQIFFSSFFCAISGSVCVIFFNKKKLF